MRKVMMSFCAVILVFLQMNIWAATITPKITSRFVPGVSPALHLKVMVKNLLPNNLVAYYFVSSQSQLTETSLPHLPNIGQLGAGQTSMQYKINNTKSNGFDIALMIGAGDPNTEKQFVICELSITHDTNGTIINSLNPTGSNYTCNWPKHINNNTLVLTLARSQ